jgi:hypothetical protein
MPDTMPTGTDGPHDPVNALRGLAAAHLDRLEQRRSAAEGRRRNRERAHHRNRSTEAVRRAAAFTARRLSRTLGQVLGSHDWTGYSHPSETTLTAAAPLGQGLWAVFRHEVSDEDSADGHREHLWLMVPTGDTYTELLCTHDDELATALSAWDADHRLNPASRAT